ncbi:hypothetical protein COTS27_00102 [Spirochaetota bacterium]|nr:hypothetical protein COTS27_00102 [Spirochaetota bacterium]
MKKPAVTIYDTSLRDGLQGEKIKLSLEEKLLVVEELDKLGIHHIEGGFPLASDQEREFFMRVRSLKLHHATICAFGSTCAPQEQISTSLHLNALLKAETEAVTVVGKSSDLHVTEVLKTTMATNLKIIEGSVAWLKKHGRQVIYDAEHFFDGYLNNPKYALQTLTAACNGGADIIVLCDTNGGTIHHDLKKILAAVTEQLALAKLGVQLGIHLHNDTGMAVANSLLSLDYGVTQVQGTLNGWGERCGNTNLALVMGNLQFKLGLPCVTADQIRHLTYASRRLNEIANIPNDDKLGYVGRSAFAHKAGQHADVLFKSAPLMEHLDATLIGNNRRILLSELAGRATVSFKMNRFGHFDKNSAEVKTLITKLKKAEQAGYEYEAAEASFDLVIRKTLDQYKKLFTLIEYGVSIESKRLEEHATEAKTTVTTTVPERTNAFVRIKVNNQELSGIASGQGPVSSLDKALRKALLDVYPFISELSLSNYKVRVLNGHQASTDAKVRVFIETHSHNKKAPFKRWETIGVSTNIIDASWQAIVDSFEFYYNELTYLHKTTPEPIHVKSHT